VVIQGTNVPFCILVKVKLSLFLTKYHAMKTFPVLN
jgi:hypothetical protein